MNNYEAGFTQVRGCVLNFDGGCQDSPAFGVFSIFMRRAESI